MIVNHTHAPERKAAACLQSAVQAPTRRSGHGSRKCKSSPFADCRRFIFHALTALTMLPKSSSSSTIPAASRATSVPRFPIAMPICAALSAGASLTPSPVMATISPWRLRASTIRSFCSGMMRAKTFAQETSRFVCIVRTFEFVASDSAIFSVNAGSKGDRQCRCRIITCNHNQEFPRKCFSHRHRHSWPQRILKANQPGKGKIEVVL